MSAAVSVFLRAFTWTLLVEVTGQAWEHATVWLRCVVPHLLQHRFLLGGEEVVLPLVFVEFVQQFKLSQLTYDGFRTSYDLAQASLTFSARVLSVEDTGAAAAAGQHALQLKTEQRQRAQLKKATAKKVVAHFEQVRDENAAQLAVVVAKSQRQVQFARTLFMRENTATGRRARLRGPYGVPVPLPFPSPATVARQLDELGALDADLYSIDVHARRQVAPLARILTAILSESHAPLEAGRVYPFVLLDHFDALAVPGAKRSVCTLWLVNPTIFARGRSQGKRWFDFEGSVQAVAEIAEWRAIELSTVLGRRLAVGMAFLDVRSYYVIGDNERLQVEIGGNLGSSVCRCFACFLPADLFPYLPRAGHSRSLVTAVAAHHAYLEASARLDMLDSLPGVRQQLKSAAQVHLRIMFGNTVQLPQLAVGATFPLDMVHFSVPVLHDVAQVLLVVKKFLNTLLCEEERLVTKEYISAAERRIEMSHWADIYGAIDPTWLFVADCASQLTATLWASSPMTFGAALRAQVCGLVLHFVISNWKADETQTNYMHGLAAHLLEFLLPLARLKLVALHFFEEEGERCTAVVRDFLATRSNHRDNLFSGVRTFERLTGALSGTEQRRRRLRTAAPTFTNLVVAPCILNNSCAHADTLAALLVEVELIAQLSELVSRVDDSLVFHVGVADEYGFVEETLVCCCGEHTVGAVSVDNAASVADWRHDVSHFASTVPVLVPQAYDTLALLLNSPFNHAPKFDVPRSVKLMMAMEPPSARRKDLEKLKLPELRERCRLSNVALTGNKDTLIERILSAGSAAIDIDVEAAPVAGAASESARSPVDATDGGDVHHLTLVQLRELCVELHVSKTGNKPVLVDRIRRARVEQGGSGDEELLDLVMQRKKPCHADDDGDGDGDGDGLLALAEALDANVGVVGDEDVVHDVRGVDELVFGVERADASTAPATVPVAGRQRRQAAVQNPFLRLN